MFICCRPDESIVSEEVSVYDIKDHPEFKFRPGHVVVRVGGYDVSLPFLETLLLSVNQDSVLGLIAL